MFAQPSGIEYLRGREEEVERGDLVGMAAESEQTDFGD